MSRLGVFKRWDYRIWTMLWGRWQRHSGELAVYIFVKRECESKCFRARIQIGLKSKSTLSASHVQS